MHIKCECGRELEVDKNDEAICRRDETGGCGAIYARAKFGTKKKSNFQRVRQFVYDRELKKMVPRL